MKKYFKIAVLTFLAVGLMSGSAFAALVGNAQAPVGTVTDPVVPATIATEVIGTSGLTIASGATGAGKVFYKATNAFVLNDVITFTFANVALKGGSFNLCLDSSAAAQADYIGAIDTTNGVSSIIFRVKAAGIAANATVALVEGPCIAETPNYTTGSSTLSLKFPVLASAQSATVSVGAVFGTGTVIPGATAPSVKLYTVANQFSSTAPVLVSRVIDFDSDMKKFLIGTAPSTLDTGAALGLTNVLPTVFYTLLATDKVGLTLSGSMSGISRICFNDVGCAVGSTTKFTIDTATNKATYDVTTSTPLIADVNKAITFVTDGTTPLSERTYTITALTKFAGSTTFNRTVETADPYWALTLDAWQAKVPFVKTDANGTDVYIKLTSTYVSTGTSSNKVKATAFCADQTISVVDVTTITPGVSALITGQALAATLGSTCITAQMKSDGWPVTLTVNAPLANVTGYGSYASGSVLRSLPIKVKQSATATANWDE